MKDDNSSLYRHSFLTDHVIDFVYCKCEIPAKFPNVFRLCVKETITILDYYAQKSLNKNKGSFNCHCGNCLSLTTVLYKYLVLVTFSMMYTHSL